MNDYEKLAELLLPHIDKTPEYFENMYPERQLPEGARVTRIAPSPTGYLHLGTLFTSLVNRITATSTGGIFYTRIEDTDKKREVEGGIEDTLNRTNGMHQRINMLAYSKLWGLLPPPKKIPDTKSEANTVKDSGIAR